MRHPTEFNSIQYVGPKSECKGKEWCYVVNWMFIFVDADDRKQKDQKEFQFTVHMCNLIYRFHCQEFMLSIPSWVFKNMYYMKILPSNLNIILVIDL